jgi:hypothetical protein
MSHQVSIVTGIRSGLLFVETATHRAYVASLLGADASPFVLPEVVVQQHFSAVRALLLLVAWFLCFVVVRHRKCFEK